MRKEGTAANGWSHCRLRDVAVLQPGLAVGSRMPKDPVVRPYLSVANVQDGHLALTEVKQIAVDRARASRYELRDGDVLMTEGGDFDKLGRGTVWRGQIPGCLHQNHVYAVRPDSTRLLSDYLAAWTASTAGRQYFRACSKQTTNLASVNARQVRNAPLFLPPVEYQASVVAVLSAWARAADKFSALLAAKRRLKRGLMQQLLTGKRRLHPYCSADWVDCTIGDLVQEAKRPVAWDEAAAYELVSVRRWSGGVFSRGQLYGRAIKVKRLYQIRAGDLLLSHIQAAYGAIALVPAEFHGTFVSDLYTVLRSRDESHFAIKYLAYHCQGKRMWHKAYLASNGFFAERLRLNFSLPDFLATRIRVPTLLEEQLAVIELLTLLDREIAVLEQLASGYRTQKRALMQQLLTGRLRVKG